MLRYPAWLVCCGLLSGCDEKLIVYNESLPPTASILSPGDGEAVARGSVYTLIGLVQDDRDAPEELTVWWRVGEVTVCEEEAAAPDNTSSCTITFEDAAEVQLFVRDTDGSTYSTSATVSLLNDEPPSAQILAPTADGVYYAGAPITFAAELDDAEDDPDDLVVQWYSNDALLDITPFPVNGEIEDLTSLEQGSHHVALYVVDSAGNDIRETVLIEVGPVNSAPTCEIIAPTGDELYPEGPEIDLSAVVTDENLGALDATWTSDHDPKWSFISTIDQSTGETGFSSDEFGRGTHVLTLSLEDELGATGNCRSTLSIGARPSITIDEPLDGVLVHEGEAVTFKASVDDEESETLTVTWGSSLDGEFVEPAVVNAGDSTQRGYAELSPGLHTITATATNDLELSSASEVILNVNGCPSAPAVSLPSATTSEELVPSILTASEDPEDGELSRYDYAWARPGGAVEHTDATLPADFTAAGETWQVTLAATDDDGCRGAEGVASISIDNSPPSLLDVTLYVEGGGDPYETSTLVCESTGSSDADGDPISLSYGWTVEGAALSAATDTLDGGWYEKGDEVRCAITPSDGTDAGAALTSAALTILNSPPTLEAAAIEPASITADLELSCSASGAADADGDAITLSYTWSINGSPASVGATLSGGFVGGDEVTCTVTPSDGADTGDSVWTTVEVSNSAPELSRVTIEPAEPYRGETLTCVPGAATDADGTADFTYDYQWTINGELQAGSGASLATDTQARGDSVTCTVTIHDAAEEAGAPVTSDAVTLLNNPPVISAASITPQPAYTDSLLAVALDTDDADGDALSVSYQWYVDGVLAGEEATLDGGALFDRGAVITVVARVDDGEAVISAGPDASYALQIPAVTVENSPPSSPTLVITPDPAEEGGAPLHCAIDVDAVDPDDDTLSYLFSWTVDGDSYADAEATDWPGDTVPSEVLQTGQDWLCTVVASDGAADSLPATAAASVDCAPTLWYADNDGDGFADPENTIEACESPDGYLSEPDPGQGDCNDANPDANPGADERCDTTGDDDCDGAVDEDSAVDATEWYADDDNDSYGDPADTTWACDAPDGYTDDDSDCDDSNSGTRPGGSESCDGEDNDCDGTIDEGVKTTWCRDSDGDGWTVSGSTDACSEPSGYSTCNATDCDDGDSSSNPGRTSDPVDGADNDCDDLEDEDVTFTHSQTLSMSGAGPIFLIDLSLSGSYHRELAIVGYENKSLYIYGSSNSGSFSSVDSDSGMGHNPRSLAAGFVNGGSNRDIVSVNAAVDGGDPQARTAFTGSSSALTSTGVVASPLEDSSGSLVVASARAVAVLEDCGGSSSDAEFIAVGDNDGAAITYWETDGAGGWTHKSAKTVSTGSSQGPLRFREEDIDGDGVKDLVSANGGGDNITVVKHTYSSACAITTSGRSYSGYDQATGIAVADFDEDGDNDIAVTAGHTGRLHILSNNGSGTFSDREYYSLGSSCDPDAVSDGDFNSDGHVDLAVVCEGSAEVRFYMGYGDGGFDATTSVSTGSSPRELAVYDFNLNGNDDFVVVNLNSDNAYVFLR